jgi:cell division septation protein DedD
MMEEQTTWKGHTFTLLVFTGIVVLCSIFFILGMLVGRQQGQKFGFVASANTKPEAKAAPKEDKPDFTFYDSVKKESQPALQPAPARKVDAEPASSRTPIETTKKRDPEPEKKLATESPAAPANVINYQIGIFRKSEGAQKLLDEVKKKGFRAFILAPAEGDANPLFKVQIGPFTDLVEAQEAKKKLESEKYQPILKK